MAGTGLVVVALPSEDDPVRKVSSEKEPHLTLLYLGKVQFDPAQLTHIQEYVEYASTMLPRFVLDVDSRGELGPNKADVLMFDKRWAKKIAEFRSQLLQDDLINAGYQSTDQFPDWVPHLTMGFPDTPAKKDTREYSKFGFVEFDRVALWTGDYSGPTFQLKTDHYDMEVAMSQTEQGLTAVDGILKHYGVKGMKWGTTHTSATSSTPAPKPVAKSADAKSADAAKEKISSSGGTHSLSNQELQGLLTRMNLERQYKTLTESGNSKEKSTLERGHEKVKVALALGKTAESVNKFLKTDTGKAVKKGIGVAAKAGLGYATGGAGAAAAAGASALLRNKD